MTGMRRLLLLVALVALAACGAGGASPHASGEDPAKAAARCPMPAPAAPPSADHPSILVQRGHATGVHRVVLSDNGRIMVTLSVDGTLLVWDTTTGLLLRRLLTAGFAVQVSLSAAGDVLAYAGLNPAANGAFAILLVDLAAGGPPRAVTDFGEIQLAPDGKTLAVGHGTVDFYDTRTLAKLRAVDVKPASAGPLGVAFDHAGQRLAVALVGEIVMIDVGAGTVARRVPRPNAGLADTIVGLAFTGDTVAVRTAVGAVELVSVAQGSAPGSAAAARALPGRVLDSAAGGGRVWTLGNAAPPAGSARGARWTERLTAWDANGASTWQEEEPTDVTHVAVSGDGSTVAIVQDSAIQGVRTVALRDGATMRPLRTFDLFTAGIAAVAVHPGGGEILTGSTLGGLNRWDLGGGELLASSSRGEEADAPSSISFDAAGALVAVAGHSYWVRVREAGASKVIRQWQPHGDHPVVTAVFVPGTTEIVTAAWDGSVGRWDLAGPAPARPTNKRIFRFDELGRPPGRVLGSIGHEVRRAALSPDGKWLALDGDDGKLGVVDAATGAVRWDVVSTSFVAGGTWRWIAFSADGARLLLSASDGAWGAKSAVLRVFDAATGALQQTVRPATAGPLAARGGILALGGVQPVLLDPATFATRAPIASFDSSITAAAVHPKRDLLILGGSGGSTAVVAGDTGKPIALLLASTGGDFVTATPEGAFVATLDGARGVAWTFADPLEGYTFAQFAAAFERPDDVRRRLAGEPPASAPPVTRPPRIAIEGAPPASVTGRAATLLASVASGGRVDSVRVFVNGRSALERAVCAPSAKLELEVPLIAGHNRVSVVGYDAAGFASNARQVDIVSTEAAAKRPDLWVVSVGVSRYAKLGPDKQLEYAAADARSIAESFAAQAGPGKAFAGLHAVTLLDEQVTVESIERAVSGLAAMGPDDLAVVFFAGHGVQLARGRMVFLTSGAALTAASATENGFGWDRIEGALGKARGRVLMLLDACHSGHVSTEIIAPNEALARQLASGGRAGVLVFAASRGSELSYEVPAAKAAAEGGTRGLDVAWDGKAGAQAQPGGGGHGLFTGSVLEALAGGAPDRDRSGAVEVDELVDFVTERVRAASNGKQTPWVARREMFGDFMIAPASGP